MRIASGALFLALAFLPALPGDGVAQEATSEEEAGIREGLGEAVEPLRGMRFGERRAIHPDRRGWHPDRRWRHTLDPEALAFRQLMRVDADLRREARRVERLGERLLLWMLLDGGGGLDAATLEALLVPAAPTHRRR